MEHFKKLLSSQPKLSGMPQPVEKFQEKKITRANDLDYGMDRCDRVMLPDKPRLHR